MTCEKSELPLAAARQNVAVLGFVVDAEWISILFILSIDVTISSFHE